MKKRFVIVAILMALLFGGLYQFSVFKKKMMGEYFASMTPPPSPVSIADVKAEVIPNLLTAVGSLEAVRQVTLSPEVSGRISAINFEAGAVVKKGDLLASLNSDPEKGDLARFQAQANLARINTNRTQKLLGVATTKTQLDQFKSQLQDAEGGLARTQAVIAQKEIHAPFDGSIGLRQVNLGQFVNPGQAIATLTDLSELYVNFTLPEQTMGLLAVGQTVRFTLDSQPGKTFEAKINAIEPQIGTETRNIKVQAILPNPDNALSPGMYAKVTVVLPNEQTYPVVPETAIDFTIYGDSVYVLKSAKDDKGQEKLTVDRVFIKTGTRFDNKVAVMTGLKAGEKVVTSGQLKLSPGAQVSLAKEDALADDYQKKLAKPTNE
ncbi:MAG: putative Co/Zn/Cd efflux system rane fusion protein [Micavibrio sp.]|nr:putative Co/Zn/Cd efflux system rane fusion protein [Micavibrio sp.]